MLAYPPITQPPPLLAPEPLPIAEPTARDLFPLPESFRPRFPLVPVLLLGGIALLAVVGLFVWLRPSTSDQRSDNPPRSASPMDRLVFFGTKPGNPQEEVGKPLSGEQIYRRLVDHSVLVLQEKGLGTGFVVSRSKRWIVTNDHVVADMRSVVVIFPLYDARGEPISDARRYTNLAQLSIAGEVIHRDLRRDLALVQVERLPDRAKEAHLASTAATVGSTVYSVGNSGLILAPVPGAEGNLLWRFTKGTVRGRVERELGDLHCMVLETDAPTNPGDSGGAIVNEYGKVVGVVSHVIKTQRQVSGNIDLEELRQFLNEAEMH